MTTFNERYEVLVKRLAYSDSELALRDTAKDSLTLIRDLLAEREGLMKLARFGLGCLRSARGEDYLVGELDGGDLQDLAEHTGVLVPVRVTEACGETCACAEWDEFPQDCYRSPEDVCAAIDALSGEALNSEDGVYRP